MFFTKPASELTYEDIADLTSSGEPESILLDYKKMVSGSGREKAELAKDICAFANSQGGYLVIGVRGTTDFICYFIIYIVINKGIRWYE